MSFPFFPLRPRCAIWCILLTQFKKCKASRSASFRVVKSLRLFLGHPDAELPCSWPRGATTPIRSRCSSHNTGGPIASSCTVR